MDLQISYSLFEQFLIERCDINLKKWMPLYNWTKHSFFFITFFFVKNLIFICGLRINFFVEKTSKFVIFLTILSFLGDILSFWKWKKSQKIWHNSRKSPRNFFSKFCTKSVKNVPYWADFCIFFTTCCWKKKLARVQSI